MISSHEYKEFQECVSYNHLRDIKYKGCFYTRNNKQEGGDRVFCKLDRVMGNEQWCDVFPDAIIDFMTERDFDHSPAIMAFEGVKYGGRRPFRYFNMWSLFVEGVRKEGINILRVCQCT